MDRTGSDLVSVRSQEVVCSDMLVWETVTALLWHALLHHWIHGNQCLWTPLQSFCLATHHSRSKLIGIPVRAIGLSTVRGTWCNQSAYYLKNAKIYPTFENRMYCEKNKKNIILYILSMYISLRLNMHVEFEPTMNSLSVTVPAAHGSIHFNFSYFV